MFMSLSLLFSSKRRVEEKKRLHVMLCDVTEDVFKDTQIDVWLQNQVILDGSKDLIGNIARNPSNNVRVLTARQRLIRKCRLDVRYQLMYIKETEDDVRKTIECASERHLTADDIGDMHKDNGAEHVMMTHLFPNDFYNSWISKVTHFLELYHGYRIYTLPLLQIMSPIGIILTPYIYLTRNIGVRMTLCTYLETLWKLLRMYIEHGEI